MCFASTGDAGGMVCHLSPWQPWGPLLTLVTLPLMGLEKMLQGGSRALPCLLVEGPWPREGPCVLPVSKKGGMGVYLRKASQPQE